MKMYKFMKTTGLILAGLYLVYPIFSLYETIVGRFKFGGLWSDEFALFLYTFPGSWLAEKFFPNKNSSNFNYDDIKYNAYLRQSHMGHIAIYLISAIVNAILIYLIFFGIAKLIILIYSKVITKKIII